MDADESSSPSLDDSDVYNMMIVTEESLELSKKRKLEAEESDFLPLPKHICLEQQASLLDSSCSSSDIETAECSYAIKDTKTMDEYASSASVKGSFYTNTYSTGISSTSTSSGYVESSIDQCCSKTQEYAEDLSLMEFICHEFADEDLQEALKPVESYLLLPESLSVRNQESEESRMKPTIDQEFEDYFSELMM